MYESNPELVETLVNENHEFKTLFQRHRELDKQIDKAGVGQMAISDESLEQMKRERLQIKDRMYILIDAHRQDAATN